MSVPTLPSGEVTSLSPQELADENREIVRRYRRLLRKARPVLKDDDGKIIRKAFRTALEAHQHMRRKSGEPYIYHPLAVAEICIEEIGLGTTAIVSALLHDVVEDTELELSDIEREFGPKVASIIDGLTKVSGVFTPGSSAQAENFRKMLLTLSDDVRVILIKIADRLHNMRTLGSMPRDKQLKISSETSYIYAPLAHRLGLYPIKTELEDLALKYTDTSTYRQIAEKIKQTRAARQRFVRQFISPLENELGKQRLRFVIKGRPKSINSIWNKMRKQHVPFEEVYDLFAIRIIVDVPPEQEKAACWQVYSIVTDFYKPNPDRLRDWISTPKSNGYESLHTTVMSKSGQWVEVQIRSQRMDDIAERGYAAHWKYKEAHGGQSRRGEESLLDTWLARVRETLESQDMSAVEFMDDFRQSLVAEDVHVFTPKGEVKSLPRGATALDFAFEIHSEVGARCLGVKANQKLVPLHYKLQTGDQLEVITSQKQSPKEDWLKFVVTSKAITKIKDSLKDEKKRTATEGRHLVLRKLRSLKVELTDELSNKLRAHFEVKTPLDFFYRVGKGTIDPTEVRRFVKGLNGQASNGQPAADPIRDAKTFERAIRKARPADEDVLLIGEDMDKIEYTMAKCCNPIPGDDVFGFITINEGIRIHRTSCPNAVELMSHYGYRIIKARWSSQHDTAFPVDLHIKGSDRVGTVNDITKVISADLRVNIRAISIDTQDGLFDGVIALFVHDKHHLERLVEKLKQVPGVVEVERYDHV